MSEKRNVYTTSCFQFVDHNGTDIALPFHLGNMSVYSNKDKAMEAARELMETLSTKNGIPFRETELQNRDFPFVCIFMGAQQGYGSDGVRHAIRVCKHKVE